MNPEMIRYSLQLRPVEMSTPSADGSMEVEILAEPNGPGQAIRTRARQWVPFLERLCTLLSSSPFHRKAMHRTLTAGIPLHVLDRTDGSKLLFSEEQIAALTLDKLNAA